MENKPQNSTQVIGGTGTYADYYLPLAQYNITSGYGNRKDPHSGKVSYHNGLDLSVPENTPIVSPLDGQVQTVSYDGLNGNYIVIKHADGSRSGYAHLNGSDVKVGDKVSAGQTIGLSGNTGKSTGPHLHFTWRTPDGKNVDPATIFDFKSSDGKTYKTSGTKTYTSGIRSEGGKGKLLTFDNPKDAYNSSYNDIWAKLNGKSSWVKPSTTVSEYINRYAPKGDGSNDPPKYINHLVNYFNNIIGSAVISDTSTLSEIKNILMDNGFDPEHEFTKMHLAVENPAVLKDLSISTSSTSSGTKKVEKPAAAKAPVKTEVKTETPKRVLTEAEKKKTAELSSKLYGTKKPGIIDLAREASEKAKAAPKPKPKPQPEETSLFDDAFNIGSSIFNSASDAISSATTAATNAASDIYESATQAASDAISWTERVAVKQGVAPVTNTQPVKTNVEYKSDVKSTGVSYIGEVPGKVGGYGTFYNKFDRNLGFEYVPIKNVGKSNNKTEYSNVKGIAHFILDSDATDDYKHEYSMKYMKDQLKGVNIAPGSTVKDQFLPIREKNKSNGRVRVKYKRVSELKNTDYVMAPLRQYKYTDINWNGKVPAEGFQSSIKALPTKSGEQTYFIFPNTENGKSTYGKFGGGSVVFLANNKNFAIDFAGSINDIKAMADKIIKEEKIKPEDLVIAYHDLGSFSAKPKADKGNKLKFTQWSDFNPGAHTGGGLAFPSN